jgi:hypothetical protein
VFKIFRINEMPQVRPQPECWVPGQVSVKARDQIDSFRHSGRVNGRNAPLEISQNLRFQGWVR